MGAIYTDLLKAKKEKEKLLAVLLDPDKIDLETLDVLILKIKKSAATHIFVGGSQVENNIMDELVLKIKRNCGLPIVIFPGNPSQISDKADGILFLSLLSGRNPDYLIEYQVNAVPVLKKSNLEIIPTAYILIESGGETAVSKISKTHPLDRNNAPYVVQTAQAGEMMGNKLVYLEAGSGARHAVPLEMIHLVAQNIEIPLIVGGGIRSRQSIQDAFDSGADLVVIGTAFENDINFFEN